MRSTRRGFIKTLAFGILGSEFISNFSIRALAKTEEDGIEIQKGYKIFNLETQKSMEALAETLVPGAKQMGIRRTFMDYISKNPGPGAFFDAGFWNLDTLSKTKFKKPFYQLENKKDKKVLIDHISVANRVFFSRFREMVIKFYYSNPAVWKRLSYSGPPQPKGFMDYWLPPKVK
jgi:gluconate 2-dehydrogenase subunit 3-like protein